ncbi:diguanylate cyclase [Kiritimatiellaeota bacterium B1221]|nr:diguanylate cyclase [Kiritimatiellaeota bacterium B1221]
MTPPPKISGTPASLPPEFALIQKMTDASFRAMDQDRALEICLVGLTQLLESQGAGILTGEAGSEWHLRVHLPAGLNSQTLHRLTVHSEQQLLTRQAGLENITITSSLIQTPEHQEQPPPVTSWSTFPLHVEDKFLGLLFLDLGGQQNLPPSLEPVLHQINTGLLSQQNLRGLLVTDPLTGCYNRWFMDVELTKFCENLSSTSKPFAVMILDIDHFKSINDQQGHAIGDHILALFSDLLRQGLHPFDATIRMGGDEFLIWFPRVRNRDLDAFGRQLLAEVEKKCRSPKTPNEKITFSMGLVIHDPAQEPISKEQLLDRADLALYTSKRKGRNQFTRWTPELESQPILGTHAEAILPSDVPDLQIQISGLKAQILRDQDHLVELLTHILSIKEFETGLHSHRVARITSFLLDQLDLPAEEKIAIHRGAKLHDIGKIAIPEAILHKEGPLSEHDWQIIKQHPRLGHRFIQNQDFLKAAGDIILYHHEQFDGKGYPRGLKGEEIPFGARLFCVVDAYDTMRANRIYKSFLPRERVTEELRSKSGSQFDPEILEFFFKHLDEIERIGCWES